MAACGGNDDGEGPGKANLADLLNVCGCDGISTDNVEDDSDGENACAADAVCGEQNSSGNDTGNREVNGIGNNTEQVGADDNRGSTVRLLTNQNPRKLIRKAVEMITDGAQKEKNSATLEALNLYKMGIELMLVACKAPSFSQKVKGVLRSKIEIYLSKAEHLKDHVIKKKRSETCTFCALDRQPDEETKRVDEYFSGFVVMKNDKRSFEAVIGHMQIKERLKEYLILPLRFPQLFTGLRRPSATMMLFGMRKEDKRNKGSVYKHPGTGKTMLFSAVAGECPDVTFVRLSIYDFFSKFLQGDAERNIKRLFEFARERSPCCLCIEDIEQIDKRSTDQDAERFNWRRIKTELLVQMEGIYSKSSDTHNMWVVLVTQRPWFVGSQLRRRLPIRIFVDLPGKEDRINILKSNMKNVRHNLTHDDFSQLGDRTLSMGGHRCTQADLTALCRDSMMQSVRKIQQAKYFKQVVDPETKEERLWTPCCHDDEGSVEMTWVDLEDKQLLEPHIEMSDFLLSMEKFHGTASADDEHQMQQWVEDFTGY